MQCFVVNLMTTGELSQSFCSYVDITASVVRLCSRWNPSTVARRVVSVIVNAIKLIAVRTPTHVFQKCGVVRAPLIGHSNSASAIPWVVIHARIIATTFCVRPCAVFSNAFTATAFAVSKTAGHCFLATKAAAAFTLTFSQCYARHGDNSSALTSADPQRKRTTTWVVCRALMHYGQAAELFVSKVYRSHLLMILPNPMVCA